MRLALALALALACAPALAHKPSDSYLTLSAAQGALRGQWDIALRDLEYAIGLDAGGDGAITWGELRARHAQVAAYALARLSLEADAQPCRLEAREHLVDEHSDGAYAVLRFDARCNAAAHARDRIPALRRPRPHASRAGAGAAWRGDCERRPRAGPAAPCGRAHVFEPRMEQAAKVLAEWPTPQKPDRVVEHERILERRDVDAVLIATTQHWHGLPFIQAAQAASTFTWRSPSRTRWWRGGPWWRPPCGRE